MQKLFLFLIVFFAAAVVSGQALVFAGGQSIIQHEERNDQAEPSGDGETQLGGAEERDQERNPDDKPE